MVKRGTQTYRSQNKEIVDDTQYLTHNGLLCFNFKKEEEDSRAMRGSTNSEYTERSKERLIIAAGSHNILRIHSRTNKKTTIKSRKQKWEEKRTV